MKRLNKHIVLDKLGKILKSVIFISILIMGLFYLSDIFVDKKYDLGTDIYSFYAEEENNLDVIFIGTSQSYTAFNPWQIYDVTGYNAYHLATPRQPYQMTYFYLKELLKTQNPKYVVVEIKAFVKSQDYEEEGPTRLAIDKLNPSINKFNAINASVEKITDRISYYIPIFKYHARYKELVQNDFWITPKKDKGYTPFEPDKTLMINNKGKENSTDMLKINAKKEKYLDKLIALAKEKNVELIFIKSPCRLEGNDQLYYNYIFNKVEKAGFRYIDYNKLFDELKLEKGDFLDYNHLAIPGAYKATTHFANYLNSLKD